MWSMAGRNVEGIHAVGDIFIKDKCQSCVKFCVSSLFMHLFLWVFLVYVACVFLLLFCMNLCICIVYVCFNLVYNSNFSCGIDQHVAGDATEKILNLPPMQKY
jgi:hypothetical protein